MNILTRKSVLICTLFIFLFLGFLSKIPIQFESKLLDPIGNALKDFELTDLVFSQLRTTQTIDTNIVLVNIGHLSRSQIGKQIEILNRYEPKVIGMDAFFRSKKEFREDIQLIMALSQVQNLVLVSDLENRNEMNTCFDTMTTSHPQFNQFAKNGFADLITDEESFRTIRQITPLFCLADSLVQSFSLVLAQIYDSASVNYLLKRNNEREAINWKGNHSKFYTLDSQELLNEEADFSFIKDKIVIMGFMGGRELGEPSLEDTFYTPLNPQSAGRAFPDMYGVTVHANAVSMILNRDYINVLPEWVDLLIAFILLYFNVAIFIWIGEKFKLYYDLVTKILILVEVALLLGGVIFILLYFQIRLNLTIAIIAIIFSGDLTELYIGSLRGLTIKGLRKLGLKLKKYGGTAN
ncbi:MAG: CHASE2 domain-containing sensor protein [Salibacteraceae bacterium]|jgi:CHASE2 domain-containing sensor protein